jgi:hypothetical protein
VKADRTVIVFGVFIFVIGLAVAWNGYGYIEVERGWSMVISGTIAFSAGLVLIGLGLILRQLKILSASAAQVALFLAKAGQNGVAAQPIAPPAPEEPAAEVEAVAEQAPVPLEVASVEQAPAPVAGNFSAPPPAWMTRATTYAAAFGAAHVAEPDAAPAEQFSDENRDWLEKAVAEEVAAQEALFRQAPVHEAAAGEAKAPEDFAPEAFAHETPADEFPAEEEREEAVVEPLAPSAVYGWEHAVEELVEEQQPQEIGALAHEPAEPEALHEPAPEPSAEVVDEEPAEPSPPSTPAILGQYEASGARYTMYVDGTIDAETPHGVYRFESMEELKRFLERSV